MGYVVIAHVRANGVSACVGRSYVAACRAGHAARRTGRLDHLLLLLRSKFVGYGELARHSRVSQSAETVKILGFLCENNKLPASFWTPLGKF